MKTLTTLLFLVIATVANCQSLPDLIREYEKHCNQIVKDTIEQHGTVTYKHIPVKDSNGEVLHYAIHPTDTVWQKVRCPEYKNFGNRGLVLYGGSSDNFILSTNVGTYGPASEVPKKIEVKRDYICSCKLREVEPFSEHFWNWIKNRKP